MIQKTLPTGLSGTLYDSPSMLSDSRGMPHAVWYKDGAINYSLFNGVAWELHNQEAFVKEGTGIYKHTICLNGNEWPSIIYGNNDGLMHVYWDGDN